MSSFDVQAALARTQAALPVIVITAHNSPAARSRALRLGAKDYCRKAADGDALVAAILRAIDVPRRRAARLRSAHAAHMLRFGGMTQNRGKIRGS